MVFGSRSDLFAKKKLVDGAVESQKIVGGFGEQIPQNIVTGRCITARVIAQVNDQVFDFLGTGRLKKMLVKGFEIKKLLFQIQYFFGSDALAGIRCIIILITTTVFIIIILLLF